MTEFVKRHSFPVVSCRADGFISGIMDCWRSIAVTLIDLVLRRVKASTSRDVESRAASGKRRPKWSVVRCGDCHPRRHQLRINVDRSARNFPEDLNQVRR